MYLLAPIVILIAALSVFAVVPFGSTLPPFKVMGFEFGNVEQNIPVNLVVAPGCGIALLLVFALSSIAVYGVILGGWASNSKYSFLGGLRSSAQLIAYELPLGLGILSVVLATGTLDLSQIMQYQANHTWFAFAQPLGFLVFTIAAFAEAARLPFDLPECEQELVGGYHTEYSGIKLLMFLVAEYLHMVTAAFLITILFLGGWHLPLLTGYDDHPTWFFAIMRVIVLSTKMTLVVAFFMLVRWSWPRFRFDQLMNLGWKIMLPLGIVNFVAMAIFYELRTNLDPNWTDWGWEFGIIGLAWLTAVVAWFVTSLAGTIIADNTPRHDLDPHVVDSQI
jgi:NADH-quinone oxidoreductase subunit H